MYYLYIKLFQYSIHRFFENLLNKFDDLNKDLMKWLPDLYHNIKKEVMFTFYYKNYNNYIGFSHI